MRGEGAGHVSKKSAVPRRFGGFLSSSRSHTEGIGKEESQPKETIKAKKFADSPLRRSVLDTNANAGHTDQSGGEDSSAAEDLDDLVKSSSSKKVGCFILGFKKQVIGFG